MIEDDKIVLEPKVLLTCKTIMCIYLIEARLTTNLMTIMG